MRRKLTLISAPASFGKTTLLSEWRMLQLTSEWPLAWVSLDKGDNDPVRFLSYFIAALQTIKSDIGEAALASLRSPQPSSIESILTALINEAAAIPDDFSLVLDDYHVVDAESIHDALTLSLTLRTSIFTCAWAISALLCRYISFISSYSPRRDCSEPGRVSSSFLLRSIRMRTHRSERSVRPGRRS